MNSFLLSFSKTSFLKPWNFIIFGAGLGTVAELNDLNFQALGLHFPELAGAKAAQR